MKKSTVDVSARLNSLAVGSGLVERLVRELLLAPLNCPVT
jgi:hypothetical protein